MTSKFLEHRIGGGLQKILNNFGWLVLQKITVVVFGITLGAWLARVLGPTDFGILSNARALVAIFTTVAMVVVPSVITRELISNPSKTSQILGSTSGALTASGVLFFLIFVTFLLLSGVQDTEFWISLCVGLPLLTLGFAPIAFWFASNLLSKHTVIPNTIGSLFNRIWGIAVVLLGGSLVVVALGDILSFCLIGVISIMAYHRCDQRLKQWSWNISLAKSLVIESLPMVLAAGAYLMFVKLDIVMLRTIVGPADAGIYTAATALSESIYFIPGALGASLLPSIIKNKIDKPEFYRSRLVEYLRFSAFLGIILAATLAMFAPFVINFLYGGDFGSAASVLAIHAWGIVPLFMSEPRKSFLVAENALWLNLPFFAVGAVTNVVLNLILIPKTGIEGAALATLLTFWISFVGSSFLHRKTREFGVLQLRALIFPFPNIKKFLKQKA